MIRILLVALAYGALAKLSFLTALSTSPAGPALAWLPTGFAVGAVLRWGYRVWPGILLGSLLNAFPRTAGYGAILGFALANTLDPLLAAWLPRRLLRRELDLSCTLDATVFILCAIFGGSLFSATLGTGTILAAGMATVGPAWVSWLVWWVSDFLGVLIVAPVMVGSELISRCSARPAAWGEIAAGCLVSAALLAFIFSMPLGRDTLHFVYWLIPCVIWLSFRGGYRVASSAMCLLSLVVVGVTAQGSGPFLGATAYESFLYVQSFLSVVTVLSLLLTAAVSERGRAIRDRDDFILLASHELRTPLTALGIQAHFLGNLEEHGGLTRLSDKERRELLRINQKEVRRLSSLVEDLLEGARVVAGQLTLQRSIVDLREVVDEALHGLAQQAAEKGVQVTVKGGPVTGRWDRRKLGFVARSLVSNALKHGEGRPVEVQLDRTAGKAVLSVADHGPGIPPQARARIFQRFGREAEVRQRSGLGQSLFVSRAVARAHGGELSLRSGGDVTVFRLELPL